MTGPRPAGRTGSVRISGPRSVVPGRPGVGTGEKGSRLKWQIPCDGIHVTVCLNVAARRIGDTCSRRDLSQDISRCLRQRHALGVVQPRCKPLGRWKQALYCRQHAASVPLDLTTATLWQLTTGAVAQRTQRVPAPCQGEGY